MLETVVPKVAYHSCTSSRHSLSSPPSVAPCHISRTKTMHARQPLYEFASDVPILRVHRMFTLKSSTVRYTENRAEFKFLSDDRTEFLRYSVRLSVFQHLED